MKQIAIIGFGVVGSGVYEVVKENRELLRRNTGHEIRVKRVLDIRDFSAHEESEIFTKNFEDILNDKDIDIVVETMGGIKFAYEYTKACLENGKSVVTSNKELVANCGDEFFKIAQKNNVRYLYEASVGGAIPVIRPIANDIAANKIKRVSGILNGTTNYILTKMFRENDSFQNALKTAQELGYAEKNPTADVDGIDACRKISILMSLVTGKKIDPNGIYTKGIRELTAEDVTYAAALNCTIKLIGMGKVKEGRVCAFVEPMLIPKESPLASVRDVFNAVAVRGNMADELMFYGRGAGKLPTASAVVGDIVDICRNANYNAAFSWGDGDKASETDYLDTEARFFIRINKQQLSEAQKEFGDGAEYISGIEDIGIALPKMTVRETERRCEKIGGINSRIRFY